MGQFTCYIRADATAASGSQRIWQADGSKNHEAYQRWRAAIIPHVSNISTLTISINSPFISLPYPSNRTCPETLKRNQLGSPSTSLPVESLARWKRCVLQIAAVASGQCSCHRSPVVLSTTRHHQGAHAALQVRQCTRGMYPPTPNAGYTLKTTTTR